MHFCGTRYIHVELIDPETDAPLALEDGAEGELVYTSLLREAMPVCASAAATAWCQRARRARAGAARCASAASAAPTTC